MKMFRFEDHRMVEKLVRQLRYFEGLLVVHDDCCVFVPKSSSCVHYNDVRRALIPLKLEPDRSLLKLRDLEEDIMGIHEDELLL